MTELEQQQNRTIYKLITRSAFLHVDDALKIGKLKLWAGRYTQGQGTSSHATAYMDADAARVVFWDLMVRGGFPEKLYPGQKWEAYGGSEREGKVIARVIRFREDSALQRAPIVIELATGPGQRSETGGIQPAGQMEMVSVFLSKFDARKLAASVLEELQAYRVALQLQSLEKIEK